MTSKTQYEYAAETILSQCLRLPAESEIAIFMDETTVLPVSTIAEVALEMDLHPNVIFFSSQMQVRWGEQTLTSSTEALLANATASLICLNNSPNCLLFRNNVRISAWNQGNKVAHMPGLNAEILLLANIDYEKLIDRCELLALALAKGRQIEIISTDNKGRDYYLKTNLDPWIRLPIISDGVIQSGAWGNIPPGETYIAPPEGIAEGEIVINGSVPGYKIFPDDEIILSFVKGKLVDWGPSHSPATQHLYHNHIEFAQNKGDENWSNLAEIGIGTNPLVIEPTGNPLLDEKKYGSIHIAIGDNQGMGGETESSIHCDMVCLSPKVFIDGKLILSDGEIVINPQEWRENINDLKPTESWQDLLMVECTATNTEVDKNGQLRKLWDTSSGRICGVPVGSEKTAKIAAQVYTHINQAGKPIHIHDLSPNTINLDHLKIQKTIYLLHQYNLINIIFT